MAAQPASPTKETDWRESEYSPEQQKFIYRLMGYAVLVIVGIIIGAGLFGTGGALFAGQDDTRAYSTNLYTEFISITITVLVLNTLAERREQNRRTADLKARLLREARSTVNDVAVQAINEIRENGWLTSADGLLKGANLVEANLRFVDLSKANLEFTKLIRTRLQRANLMDANLIGAQLEGAKLQGANLASAKLLKANLNLAKLRKANLNFSKMHFALFEDADLQFANLWGAELQSTLLWNTNLKGAYLNEAKIVDANLFGAQFDETTVLPDGTRWSSGMEKEMTKRFGCVFISPDDKQAWKMWYEGWKHKQYTAAGTAED